MDSGLSRKVETKYMCLRMNYRGEPPSYSWTLSRTDLGLRTRRG